MSEPSVLRKLLRSAKSGWKWYAPAALVVGAIAFAGQLSVLQLRSAYLATAEVDIGGFSITKQSAAPEFVLIEPLARTISFYEKNGPDFLGVEVIGRCSVGDGLRGSDTSDGIYRDLFFVSITCRNDSESAVREDVEGMVEILLARHDQLFEMAENVHEANLSFLRRGLALASISNRDLEINGQAEEADLSDIDYRRYDSAIRSLAFEQELSAIEMSRYVVTTSAKDEVAISSRVISASNIIGIFLVSTFAAVITFILLVWGSSLRHEH